MPRQLQLQQASQMSMLEISNILQENIEEKKRMEAETDKLYCNYLGSKFNRGRCPCKECDERQAKVDAIFKKYKEA